MVKSSLTSIVEIGDVGEVEADRLVPHEQRERHLVDGLAARLETIWYTSTWVATWLSTPTYSLGIVNGSPGTPCPVRRQLSCVIHSR
jgi:hypothetical protein